ncbi:hypothetical protein ABZX92_32680 [Lentzea sp. NPDC006480]|uniref:hypothetical protein n=1 Tax=Lentzea sp. NPDC006480 TaxID=3157176 RepID=UPI0033A5D2B0
MEDLLKDLARLKPPVPAVDPERMERDLARITATRRTRSRSFKRFAPLAVAAVVIGLVVVLLPKPTPPVQPGGPARWWHALTRQWSMMIVGDPANPYAVFIDSKTDRWLSANQQVTVVQKDGDVRPFSLQRDADPWEAAGRPATVPQVGGTHLVRIGPMKPAVQKTDVAGFQMSLHSAARLDSLDSLPADARELKKTLEPIVGKDPYRIGSLAMELMASNVRHDQRQAVFELLKTLDGARFLGEVRLSEDRAGIGVAIPAPPTFQFAGVETQLVINPETGMPVVRRDMITTAQHGLPANSPISVEEYLLLEQVSIDPIVPQDVPVNAEVESPIIER